jgi:hypothetical protein
MPTRQMVKLILAVGPSSDKKNHADRVRGSPEPPVPQDGCGTCSWYIMDPETKHVCYDQFSNTWCESDYTTEASGRSAGASEESSGIVTTAARNGATTKRFIILNIVPVTSQSHLRRHRHLRTASPNPSPTATCNPATKPNNDNCFCAPPILLVEILSGIAPVLTPTR